jgi:hypothetical protein
VAGAAVAAAAALLTAAGPAPAAGRHAEHATFAVQAKTLAETQIDLGEPGLSPGDQQVLTEDLYRDGKRVGEAHIVCTIVRVTPDPAVTGQCVSTATLPGGQIASQGVVSSAQIETSPFVQAVTGGTGRYAGVRGELTVAEAGPQPATLTFSLKRR